MSRDPLKPRSFTSTLLIEGLRIVAVAAVTVGIGVSSGYVSLTGAAGGWQPGEAADESSEPASATGVGGVLPLEPILVNLSGGGTQAFLRTSMSLMLTQPERAREIQASDVDRTRLRAAIVELLAGRTAESLATPEGRTDLKRAITKRAGATLTNAAVTDVLFTDFVVQY